MKQGELTRRLRRLGFRYYAQAKGSHEISNTEKRVTIPRHPNKEIASGTLAALLRDLDLTLDELRKS